MFKQIMTHCIQTYSNSLWSWWNAQISTQKWDAEKLQMAVRHPMDPMAVVSASRGQRQEQNSWERGRGKYVLTRDFLSNDIRKIFKDQLCHDSMSLATQLCCISTQNFWNFWELGEMVGSFHLATMQGIPKWPQCSAYFQGSEWYI